jgi:hypothetical protein
MGGIVSRSVPCGGKKQTQRQREQPKISSKKDHKKQQRVKPRIAAASPATNASIAAANAAPTTPRSSGKKFDGNQGTPTSNGTATTCQSGGSSSSTINGMDTMIPKILNSEEDETRRREDAAYQRMHFAIRMNFYLQALDREKAIKQAKMKKRMKEQQKRLQTLDHYDIRKNIYLQALYSEQGGVPNDNNGTRNQQGSSGFIVEEETQPLGFDDARRNVPRQVLDRPTTLKQQPNSTRNHLQELDHYDIRMNIYLQALDCKKQMKRRRASPPPPPPPPTVQQPLTPQQKLERFSLLNLAERRTLEQDTGFHEEQFQTVQDKLERELHFKPPLTLTQAAASDPLRAQDLMHKSQHRPRMSFNSMNSELSKSNHSWHQRKMRSFDSELSKSNHNQSRHVRKRSLDSELSTSNHSLFNERKKSFESLYDSWGEDSDSTLSNHGPKKSFDSWDSKDSRAKWATTSPEAQSAWKKMKAVVYAVAFVNELKKQAGYHELNIGYVGPKLKAMILTGQTEYRPPPPPELLQEYKPVCVEAAHVGAQVKLAEKVVEAYGQRSHLEMDQEKSEQQILVSSSWDPKQRVGLPKITNRRSNQQKILVEAAALGRIKRCKPQYTYNYDPKEELGQSFADFWFDPDEEIHYDKLDDVPLPTQTLPLYQPLMRRTITHDHYAKGLLKGVVEYAEYRRKLLEIQDDEGDCTTTPSTPTSMRKSRGNSHIASNSKLRVRERCDCIYCKTSNPYQTNAYRRMWLLKKGLWKPGKLTR